jgi:dimethylglycine dehydrogenase
LLLEKNELTAGSTWHAAGNCPNFSASWTLMKLQGYSTELYARLADEVDYPINYHVTGSIRLAHTAERMQEFCHVAAMGRHMDLNLSIMSAAELRQAYPFLETHDLEGGLWDPTDGDIDPAQLTQALAKGARDLGARIVRACPVEGARRQGGEWVLQTPMGEVRCQYVVNAAGYRAREVGQMFGRQIPCVSLSHQYLVTEAIPELADRSRKLPLLRDPDSSYYLRQEMNGLLLGPYEKDCRAYWTTPADPMPDDFSFQLFPDDLERLEWYIEDACARVPILSRVGISRVVNGPIPYTPDGNPLLGPMPGVPDAFEAGVFTFGIVQAGGAGKVLADWIVEGETEGDCWAVDPRRFTEHATQAYTEAKAIEVYSHEYATHFPGLQWPAGRPAKTSANYEALRAKGAEFGAYGGWERADWFPERGEERGPATSYARQHWFEAVGRECRHVARHVGILDLPGFSRFEVSGPGAADWLDRLITGRLPKVGRIALAYLASPQGKILSEMTVTRFAEDRFWLMSGAAAQWHDRDWLLRHLPDETAIRVDDVTGHWSALILSGPKSRQVMAAATGLDLADAAFPWLSHQAVEIGGAHGHAIRVSYTGELGWELHLPAKHAHDGYQRLWQAGEPHQIRDFGMLALESLRLEKAYRGWKTDLSNDYTMVEGGLGGWIKADKGDFVGRESLLAQLEASAGSGFATLVVDEPTAPPLADAVYLSTVFDRVEAVGLVLSAGYGHRVEKSIALCVLDRGSPAPGTELEIEILGSRRRAVVAAHPALYDPDNTRLSGS